MAFIGNGAQLTDLDAGDIASGTLPVARGGTGTASPAIVAGSGISVSGTWPNQTVAVSGGNAYVGNRAQIFTSSGTFTVPTGVTAVRVMAFGGGAGGQGSNYNGENYNNGISGGPGAYNLGFVTGLTPESTVSVTVGGGGNGGQAGNASLGNAGGASSFGSFVTANGGSGNGNQGSRGGNSSTINSTQIYPDYGNRGPGGTGAANGGGGGAGVVVVEW